MDHLKARADLAAMANRFTDSELDAMAAEASRQGKSLALWAHGLLIGIPRAWAARKRLDEQAASCVISPQHARNTHVEPGADK